MNLPSPLPVGNNHLYTGEFDTNPLAMASGTPLYATDDERIGARRAVSMGNFDIPDARPALATIKELCLRAVSLRAC